MVYVSSLVRSAGDFGGSVKWTDTPEFVSMADPSIYMGGNYVTLDFEIDTSHGDFGHPVWPENQMLLAVWSHGPDFPSRRDDEGPRVNVVWGSEFQLDSLLRDIEEADFLVCHNAKYELGWLKRCGLDLGQVVVFCTKIAEFVLSGNLSSLTGYSTSLDDCCIRRGWPAKDPIVDHMMKDNVNPVRIPRAWLQGRCEQDVSSTEKLFLDQRESLQRQAMLPVLYTRCLLTPVLADMEFQGMCLDPARVQEAYDKELKVLNTAKERLNEIAQINWNSDKQKAELIYGDLGFEEKTNKKGEPIRTAGDKPKTDGDTLLSLGAKTKEQKSFLKHYKQFNAAEAALTKSLQFFKGVCDEHGGTFFAEFNQTVAATHRLSSSGQPMYMGQFEKEKRAQFQNLANRFKNLFKAKREGWHFCEWDGSGLEFRFAGLLSGDPAICADINDPSFDPHRKSAAIINNIDEDDVQKEQRRKAKAHTFKPLFGGVSGTAGERRYYKAFNKRYAGLAKAQESWAYQVVGTKHFRTPWGLTFRFPYARMEKDGYINVKTNVYNYPIQAGSTAEIIPLAVVVFYHLVRAAGLEDKIIMVNTVHDSVLCEVHPDALDQYKELAVEAWHYVYWYFEEIYRFPLKGLPLGTEVVYGSHWSEGDEEAFNIYQDGRVETV